MSVAGERDAVVVGAGPNGLAAAIALAREGLDVLLVEAEDEVGGAARTAELTLPGFHHDVCSAVHPLAAASPFFSILPLAKHGLEWCETPVPAAHPLEGRPAALLTRDVRAMAATLGADARAWTRLLAPHLEAWPALLPELLAPFHIPFRHPIAMARFGAVGLRSALAIARRFEGDAARALWGGLSAHSFLALERSPSAAVGMVLALSGHAAGWPIARGGSGRITAALASHFAELGGEIHLRRRIATLDELPPSRAVLLDLTPRQVLAVCGDRLAPWYALRLAGYRYGPAAFRVDWAMAGPVPWADPACADASTVHLGGTLEEVAAAERACARGEMPERPFVLFSQPTRFDAERAPAGRHVGWAYGHVPHGWSGDATAAIEAQIERFAPGFRELILGRVSRGPRELERDNPNLVGGDINGGAQDLAQLFARPVAPIEPYATPLRGVFLCSSSTPPGGGVHGMCGWHSARAALRQVFGRRISPLR